MSKEDAAVKSAWIIHPIPLIVSATFPAPLWRWGAGKAVPLCWYVWYLEGSGRKILVDSGVLPEQLLNAGFACLRHLQSLEQGLGKFGIQPADIDLVIQTHLHFDHTGDARKFSRAKFLVQKTELNYHRRPPPPAIDPRPCPRDLLEALDWEVVDGDSRIEEGLQVLLTPGHTAGGQSVAVETAKGTAIIAGLCSVDENFLPPQALKDKIPVFVPGITNDPGQGYESQLRIIKLANIILPIHEIRFAFTDQVPLR